MRFVISLVSERFCSVLLIGIGHCGVLYGNGKKGCPRSGGIRLGFGYSTIEGVFAFMFRWCLFI